MEFKIMTRESLSDTEQRYWHFILSYESDKGYVPALGQIAEEFGISKQGASYRVDKLAAKGYLEKFDRWVGINYRIVEVK